MKIEGHYDKRADMLGCASSATTRRVSSLRQSSLDCGELDPSDRQVVGLEYWHASRPLPDEFLKMLPAPPLGVAP
jgi:hypothetical protein